MGQMGPGGLGQTVREAGDSGIVTVHVTVRMTRCASRGQCPGKGVTCDHHDTASGEDSEGVGRVA